MLKTIASKVVWVGRATTFCVGLAVILAVMVGVGTTVLAAVPGDPFRLGKFNVVDHVSTLAGSIPGAVLKVDNDGSGTALTLRVGDPDASPSTKTVAPMKVDSQVRVENLNSDKVDGLDASSSPTPNNLLPLDGSGKFHPSAMPGIVGFETHTNTTNMDSSDDKSIIGDCAGDRRVIGGGAQIIGSNLAKPKQITVTQSTPDGGGANYQARASEIDPGTSGEWALRITVVCARVAPPTAAAPSTQP